MRRLTLALVLPLAFASACVIKLGDSNDESGSGGGSTGGDTDTSTASATSEPETTDPSSPTTTAGTTAATSTSTTGATTQSTTTTTTDPSTSTTTTTDPSTSTTTGGVDPDEAATQLCVDTINMYRATLGLPALARWKDAEDCSDAECLSDGMTGTPHGAFGMCGEFAQNECPGWPGDPADMITGCLEVMWAEGPGEDFNLHGHYINMSNPDYTKVACGFAPGMGGIWAVQNFQ
jgi:hypothetical protein